VTSPRSQASREKIIAAALRCFARAGISATSMDDIAREAGMGRKTVYRQFGDRRTLLDAVLLHRILEAIDDTRRHIEQYETLREAIVQATLYGIRWVAKDQLYAEIVASSSERSIESLVLNSNPSIRDSYVGMWLPLFRRARETGELRSSLADEWIAEYVRTIGGLLILRSDLTSEEQGRFIQDFLINTIFC
jgi:AcrR family transcriptional regulator